MASLIKSDLVPFRCEDGFIAQQKLAVRPKDGMPMDKTLMHIGMKSLMETMGLAIAHPPVISTNIAFAGEELERYQRLEWPKLLKTYGFVIMANGQKFRIQHAQAVNAPAIRAQQKEKDRENLVFEALMVDIDLNANRELSWAVLDELAKEVYQADIRPAAEIAADEIIIEDDPAIINLDSGVSTRNPTPISMDRPGTPLVPPSPARGALPVPPPPPVVPLPSARPPSPPVTAETLARELALDGLAELRNLQTEFMKQMDNQQKMADQVKQMCEESAANLMVIRTEMKNLKTQVNKK